MIVKNNLFSENPEPECVYFKRFAQATYTTETHVHLLLKGREVKMLSQYADKILHIPHLELKLIGDYKLLSVNSLSKLTNLKSLELDNLTFKQLDALCPHLTHLEELILGQYFFTSLPESFKNLKHLRVLDIQENDFHTIPNIIFNLTQLKKLNIYSNAIKKIPDGIGALTQLTDLCISACQLETLPDSIGQLKQLKTLDLSYNYIYSLPKSMTELKNLESVNLASNGLRIEAICPFLLELPQLKYVYLNALLLNELPDVFYTLKNLDYLNLSENQLSLETFFRAAESVQNPTSIHIHSPNIDPNELFDDPPKDPVPYITEIPDAIGRFTQLKAFSIAQANDIIKISPKIAQLTQLETVSFYGLKVLETFPDVFDQLPNLHTLTIENCGKLKYYPSSIYKLQHIKSLRLSENNCLPNLSLLKQMITLSSLSIPMVAPTELEHLAALTALASLHFESNSETPFLPPALRQLTHLKQVQFGNCPKLDIAQALQQLPYLERFEIHEAIQTENLVFPPTIRELHLNYGSVSPTTLLHWVETLPHLETVIIERFSDNYIPKKITLLNKLKHFFVKKHVFYGTEPLEWVLLDRPKLIIGESNRWTAQDASPIETAAHRVQDLRLFTNKHKMFVFGFFSGMTRLLNDGLDNPFAQPERLQNSIFYIMGKPSWQTSSLLKADLKTFGAKTTPNWMDATHILICPQSHDDMLWKAILTSDKKLVLEDYLKHKMLKLDTPFLINAATESEDSEALQNITQLLYSKGEDNTALILEMITAGGAPRRLLSYLTAIHLKHPVKPIQKKAKLLFQKYASLDLQTHIEGQLTGQPDDENSPYPVMPHLYEHPDIDLFDALFAERMIEFHHSRYCRLEILELSHYHWASANTGLKRMFFLTNIKLLNTQNFDYQQFIDLIQDIPIERLELLELQETVDLTPLWAMKTLQTLHLSTKKQGLTLRLPPILVAPLEELRVSGFKLLDTTHIDKCLLQIKDIQIRHSDDENHELPF